MTIIGRLNFDLYTSGSRKNLCVKSEFDEKKIVPFQVYHVSPNVVCTVMIKPIVPKSCWRFKEMPIMRYYGISHDDIHLTGSLEFS